MELRDLLINSDIDILGVQESKLWKTDKTPFIGGYATIRKDRLFLIIFFVQSQLTAVCINCSYKENRYFIAKLAPIFLFTDILH